jgi:TolB-like protein/tetratricopeptide (TPR) repeat protein/transcriptional regulator with XRE-family HTH domain
MSSPEFRGASGSHKEPLADATQGVPPDRFAARLALALNVLNFSRAQLSAAAAVDKSLVSRWLSGQVLPTSHNLARVSEALAQRKPGFNMTLWTAPRAEFDAFFGLSPAASVPQPVDAAPAEKAEAGPKSKPPFPTTRFRWAAGASAAIGIVLLGLLAWLWWSAHGHSARSNLPAIAEAPTAPAGSIAVLPLANIRGDARERYLSDGLTEELIATLAKVPGLRVAARSSSFAFAGKNTDIHAIARALNVRSIVEGSVRQDGDRVRIALELINASDGFQRWSQTYDRDLKNILSVQNEIAQSVAKVLSPARWRNADPATAKPVEIDPAVYRKYLQAQMAFSARTAPGTERAATLLRDVTRAAPNFADAFAAQAATLFGPIMIKSADARTVAEFESALGRALRLDATNPQALAVQIDYEAGRLNWNRVIADAVILRRMYPHNATALQGLFSAYRALGLYDLAVSAEREAARLDPLSYIARRKLGGILVSQGKYGEAIAPLKSSLDVQPGQPSAMSELCYAYAFVHRIAEAKSIQSQLSLPGMPAMARTYCTMGLALSSGDTAKARATAEEVAAHLGIAGAGEDDLGKVFAAAGDFDRAMDWFERAYDKQIFFFDVYSDVSFPRALFETPRWRALAERPAFRKWREASAQARKLFTAGNRETKNPPRT